MTILISLFGFAGRYAGDLLMSSLGWASSLLFGRVPRSHQVLLVLMLGLSFLWLLVVLSLIIPSIGSFLLSATPHPPFVDKAWLGTALLAAAILVPLVIGVAGVLVPGAGERPTGLAALVEVLRGYVLAPLIGGLMLYLGALGISRNADSARRGWKDIHVAIVADPDGYDELAASVQHAVESAGLAVTVHDAPRAVTAPGWLLSKVAGPGVRRLRPARLLELTGRHVRVRIYPYDIAISGTTGSRTRARAAILGELVASTVHLTNSAEAQAIEDGLRRIAKRANRRPASFESIDDQLLDLDVPTDEWDVLYRTRLQIERDLLVHAEPGSVFPGHTGTEAADRNDREDREDVSAGRAVRSARAPS